MSLLHIKSESQFGCVIYDVEHIMTPDKEKNIVNNFRNIFNLL